MDRFDDDQQNSPAATANRLCGRTAVIASPDLEPPMPIEANSSSCFDEMVSSNFDTIHDEMHQEEALPPVNTPTEEGVGCYDVLCGRHKAAFNNVGNRRFRVTVSLALDRYLQAKSRKDRSVVIASVAALVHSIGGRFLQRKKGAWVELSEKEAHNKTGHALRDLAAAVAKNPDRSLPSMLAIAKETKTQIKASPAPTTVSTYDDTAVNNDSSRVLDMITTSTTPEPTVQPSPFDDTALDISPEELFDLHQAFAEGINDEEEDQMLAWLSGESSKVILHEV